MEAFLYTVKPPNPKKLLNGFINLPMPAMLVLSTNLDFVFFMGMGWIKINMRLYLIQSLAQLLHCLMIFLTTLIKFYLHIDVLV